MSAGNELELDLDLDMPETEDDPTTPAPSRKTQSGRGGHYVLTDGESTIL